VLDLVGLTLGQYRITEQLGRGGMANVYKGFHPGLSVDRAIKVIRPDLVQTEGFRERFQREAQAVASLRHPNIVTVHDFGEQDGMYYMVMEFIRGSDLKKFLRSNGPLRPLQRAVDIVSQIADALHAAHTSGLLHRDIKSENIMLTDEGMPILTDFGIAKLLTSSSQLTQTGFGIGTPVYMAPEQAQGLPTIGPPADLYSLTVVLYELLTGRVPFEADTPMAVVLKAIHDPMPLPRTLVSSISNELQQVILKGAAKDPADRYQSGREFMAALKEIPLEDEAPLSPPPSMATAQKTAAANGAGRAAIPPAGAPVSITGTGATFLPRTWAVTVGAAVAFAALASLWWVFGSREAAPVAPQHITVGPVVEPDMVAPAPALPDDAATSAAPPIVLAAGDTSTLPAAQTPDAAEAQPQTDAQPQTEALPQAASQITAGAEAEPQAIARAPEPVPAVVEAPAPALAAAETAQVRVLDGGEVRYGQFRSARLSQPGERLRFAVAGRANDALFFDFIRSSNAIDFTLMAPDGRTQVFAGSDDVGPFQLPQDGTYALFAQARGAEPSEFEFILWHLEVPQVDGGDVRVGAFVSNQTTVPGQTVRFRYVGRAGERIDFKLLDVSEPTNFRIIAPDGRVEVMNTLGDRDAVELPQAGVYTLVAQALGDNLTQFEFQLLPSRK